MEEMLVPPTPTDSPISDLEWEEAIERNAEHALIQCASVVTGEVDGEHACNSISIIVPGGISSPKSGFVKPVWQATQHMGEAVYGSEAFSTELPMHDEAPGVVNGQTGTLSWLLLERWQARPKLAVDPAQPWLGWYTFPPYDCKAKNEAGSAKNSCDEYPWWATNQGGPTNRAGAPQTRPPHLRIIKHEQNEDSGRELGAFYRVCDVDDGETFVSAPTPLAWIPLIPGAGALEDLPMHHLIPTLFLGEADGC